MSLNAAMGVDHPCDFTPDHSMERSSLHIRSFAVQEGRDARQVLNKDGALGKFPQVLKQESMENWCRCSHVGRRRLPSW